MFFLILKVIADSASVLRSRKQVVTMIATVVVFFFVCMFPIKVCIFYEIFMLWMWGQINFLEKHLTDDAWVSGPDLAPQKFLLSQ